MQKAERQDMPALRDEAETPENLLASPEPEHGRIRQRLRAIRFIDDAAETALGDAINASRYITAYRYPRILGYYRLTSHSEKR